MKDTYHVPWYNHLARRIILPIFRLIFDGLSKLSLEGMDNFPKEGPYLIIFNHVSLYDAPVVVCHLPKIPEVLGASDIWNRPGQDFLAKAYGGIPIHRGEVDRNAMYKMLAAVNAGRPLLIAPEGGRSQKPGMRRGKPGIIFLLEKNKLPVVPIGITGTTVDYVSKMLHGKKPSVHMKVGKPFLLPNNIGDGLPRAEAYQLRVDFLMQKIAELLPPDYRGFYS